MSSTETGAWGVANRIREYWLQRGYIVGLRVEKMSLSAERLSGKGLYCDFWCIRSDMVNGLPTRRMGGLQ